MALAVFVVMFPILEGMSNEGAAAGTTVLGAALVVIWMLDLIRRSSRFHIGAGGWLLVGFTLVASASLLWTDDPRAGGGLLFRQVQVLVLYLVAYDILRSSRDEWFVLGAYVAGALGLAATAVPRISSGQTYANLSNRFSAVGTDPNNFAVMVAAAIGVLLGACAWRRRREAIGATAIAGALAVVLAFTGSRSGLVALGLAVLGAVAALASGARWWRAGVITIGCAAVIGAGNRFAPALPLQRLVEFASSPSLQGRTESWASAFDEWSTHPVLGAGIGGLATATGGGGEPLEAHSTFLRSFSELGLLGGACWLALWVVHLCWAARLIRRSPGDGVALGASLGVLAVLAGATFLNWEFRKPLYLFWALAAAAYRNRNGRGAMRSAYADTAASPTEGEVLTPAAA